MTADVWQDDDGYWPFDVLPADPGTPGELGPVAYGSASLVDPATLRTWLGDQPLPQHWTRLVRAAGQLVDYALRWATYPVYTDRLPVLVTQRRAMVGAIAEQLRAWSALGVDPGDTAAGVVPPITTATINKATIVYALPTMTAEQTLTTLVPAAQQLLAQAFTVTSVRVR